MPPQSLEARPGLRGDASWQATHIAPRDHASGSRYDVERAIHRPDREVGTNLGARSHAGDDRDSH